jgi:hypothetical protein
MVIIQIMEDEMGGVHKLNGRNEIYILVRKRERKRPLGENTT